MAMRMALLPTPPNSGKEPLHHRFSPHRAYSGDHDELDHDHDHNRDHTMYSPLFAPIASALQPHVHSTAPASAPATSPTQHAPDYRPASPSDVLGFRSHRDTTASRSSVHSSPLPVSLPIAYGPISTASLKRSRSDEYAPTRSIEYAPLQHTRLLDEQERSPLLPPSKRARVDSGIAGHHEDEILFSDSPEVSPRTPHAPLQRTVSPPLPEHYELFSWFISEFRNAFISEQRQHSPSSAGQWLVVSPPTSLKAYSPAPLPARQQQHQSQRKHRHRSEVDDDFRPKKSGHQRIRSGTLQLPLAKGDAKTTRSPANKALVSKDYRDWPDYAPGPSTLDGARPIAEAMSLMSGRKDLSQDPLRDELHPVELIAANHAGIDCARYLCTKRSVFVGYLKHLLYKHGKRDLSAEETKKGLRSWNKTAAQNCSSIDVNKTSCLFAEFWQRADWFNESHFQHYVDSAAGSVKFPIFDKDGHLVEMA